MLIKGNAAEPTAAGGAAPSPKPDSGHANTISITHRAHRTSLNAMKPRIQRAWAQRVVATVPVGDPSVFTICGEGGRGGVRGWGRPLLGLALDACRPGPQRSPGSRPARRAVAAGDAEQPGGRRGGPGTLRGAPAGR